MPCNEFHYFWQFIPCLVTSLPCFLLLKFMDSVKSSPHGCLPRIGLYVLLRHELIKYGKGEFASDSLIKIFYKRGGMRNFVNPWSLTRKKPVQFRNFQLNGHQIKYCDYYGYSKIQNLNLALKLCLRVFFLYGRLDNFKQSLFLLHSSLSRSESRVNIDNLESMLTWPFLLGLSEKKINSRPHGPSSVI